MRKPLLKQAIVAGLAGAVLIGSVDASFSAPVPAGTAAAVKSAVPSDTVNVQWRFRRGWGWRGWGWRGWGPGVGLGLGLGLFGAALASAATGPYYGYYGWDYPAYAWAGPRYYGYGYAPAYAYYGSGWGWPAYAWAGPRFRHFGWHRHLHRGRLHRWY